MDLLTRVRGYREVNGPQSQSCKVNGVVVYQDRNEEVEEVADHSFLGKAALGKGDRRAH